MRALNIISGASLLVAAIALSSCGTKPQEAVVDGTYMASVENRLSKAAEQAAKAQTDLARIQKARTNPAPLPLDEIGMNLPEELLRPATMEWSGPAEEAAMRIAKLVGYDFRVVGNRPSIPAVVHVSLQDVPAAKALEQIGLQAHPFGEVAVDPNQKRVEFRYLPEQTQPITPRGTSPSWGK